MNKNFLYATVASFVLSGAAQGQSAQPVLVADQSPVAGRNKGIEEITITAERRSESAQKAALGVQVLSGDAMADRGIQEPTELSKLVPGLTVSTGNGPVAQFYVRGVGTSINNVYGDNAVAFGVDGVNWARATGLNGEFYDLQRVEVLTGPQGTLYG